MTAPGTGPRLDAPDLDSAVEALRAGGLRVSAARRLVLEALYGADGPVTAEQVAGGQLRLERDQRDADGEQRAGVAEPPPRAQPGGPARVAVVGRHQRGDRHEVVGVGRVAQPEHEGDPEGDDQRRAVDEAGEPLVQMLDGAEEELEVHDQLPSQSGQEPRTAKWLKRAS